MPSVIGEGCPIETTCAARLRATTTRLGQLLGAEGTMGPRDTYGQLAAVWKSNSCWLHSQGLTMSRALRKFSVMPWGRSAHRYRLMINLYGHCCGHLRAETFHDFVLHLLILHFLDFVS